MIASLNYPYSPSKLCSQAPKWACRKTEANGPNPAGFWEKDLLKERSASQFFSPSH